MTAPTPIRIAIQIQQAHATYGSIRDAARRLDELGVDIIYVWDHFFPLYGDPEGPNFECWTTLASLAEVTSRAEIGPLVACSAYRNPHLVADMARTVDHVSGGRMILGIGAGWFERDFHEYGYEFGDEASRVRSLGRYLPTLRGRLARLSPPPLRPIPILVGGGGERVTLRIAAQHADIWHCFGDPTTFAHKSRVLDSWCERIGRHPGEISRSVSLSDEYDGTFDRALGDAFVAAGAGHLTFKVVGPDFDLSHVHDWLVWRDETNAGQLEG